MSSPLAIYKNGLIAARRATYNADVSRLSSYYKGLIDGVNRNIVLSRRAKINNINALIRARTSALNALRAAFNKDMIAINRVTSLPSQPIPLRPPTKNATLVGINYIGTPNRLNGCINDTVTFSTLLTTQFGYDATNITFMTDETPIKPTRANILNAFSRLVVNAQAGDTLFFLYSGHGTQQNNNNNPNPADKIDECIYPIDGKIITDIEFKQIIDANLKAGVTLVAIFDSCFSGTIMNLRYNYLNGSAGDQLVVDAYAAETQGNIICISGCKDTQTSEEAFIGGKYGGALTWSINNTILNDNNETTWGQLVENMRSLMISSEYTQIPQFSSGKAINMGAQISL